MNAATHTIIGGDYEGGGSASKRLKEMLKKIGVDAQTVRKTMIAAYEAEMNVVIHAHKGQMKVAVAPAQVDVAVVDEGPGIPDIEQAMTEGFSTAPPAAREMGFGAGMGLPNIKRNSDRFSIQSVVGRGTQVRFTIFLQPQTAGASPRRTGGVQVIAERCRECLACLRACPTAALRVRGGRPHVLEHLCIECTSCMAACDTGAFILESANEIPAPREDTLLVLPAAFLEQFGAGISPGQVLGAVREMGFRNVRLLEDWENALRTAAAHYAREEAEVRPVLSPMCPAIVNLIQVRYPSLIAHVAPFLTPIEAAREELTASHAVFLAVCPAQRSVLGQPSVLTQIDVVSASAMRNAAFSRIAVRAREVRLGKTDLPGKAGTDGFSSVPVLPSGIGHVIRVLDAVENGLMNDYSVIELFACDQGCFGSPVWTEDPFVTRPRYHRAVELYPLLQRKVEAGVVRRIDPLEARAGTRLDADMGRAIEKLARIDELTKGLPGRNCSVCGAPTCAALAEDVVLGRAEIAACLYRDQKS